MAEREGSGDLSQTLAAGSEATFDHVCYPCSHENKICEAVGFCVDCSEFLCDSCYKVHLKPAPCRDHKLLDIENATKNPNVAGSLDVCTEKCSQHKTKVIEYYCPVHDHLGCGPCITLDHRNCEGVQYIPKVVMDNAGAEEFDRIIEQLDEILRKASELSNQSTNNKVKSQAILDNALQHVRQVRKDVNEVFDRWERNIESEGKNIKQRDLQKMDDNIQSFDKIKSQTDNLAAGLKNLKQKGQNCNLFVSIKTNQQEIQSLQHSLGTLQWDNAVTEYLFQPSEQLENFIKHRGSLGQIRLVNKSTKVGEIRVRVKSDARTCDISGLAMITSGRLVAADCDNDKVKLIDIHSSRVLSEYQLQSWPHDITSTEVAGEVAVTVPGLHQVLLLRLRGDSLHLHKTIKTTCMCYGVTSVKDKLVVSLTEPERLEIMTKQGSLLHNIYKDRQGHQLFCDVRSLSANQETETIYVSDCYNHTVTSVSMSGQVLGIYRDSDLEKARGVTVDPSGAVYVCGVGSNNVHQITSDCRKLSILLSEKVELSDLRSLCYDKETDMLFVGQKRDTIKVY